MVDICTLAVVAGVCLGAPDVMVAGDGARFVFQSVKRNCPEPVPQHWNCSDGTADGGRYTLSEKQGDDRIYNRGKDWERSTVSSVEIGPSTVQAKANREGLIDRLKEPMFQTFTGDLTIKDGRITRICGQFSDNGEIEGLCGEFKFVPNILKPQE